MVQKQFTGLTTDTVPRKRSNAHLVACSEQTLITEEVQLQMWKADVKKHNKPLAFQTHTSEQHVPVVEPLRAEEVNNHVHAQKKVGPHPSRSSPGSPKSSQEKRYNYM